MLNSAEKTTIFLKQVEEIQAKRKGTTLYESTILVRNKFIADNWRVMSPKRRAALQSYSEVQQSLAKNKRSLDSVNEYKQSIFQANKWDIIKIRKAEMLKRLN